MKTANLQRMERNYGSTGNGGEAIALLLIFMAISIVVGIIIGLYSDFHNKRTVEIIDLTITDSVREVRRKSGAYHHTSTIEGQDVVIKLKDLETGEIYEEKFFIKSNQEKEYICENIFVGAHIEYNPKRMDHSIYNFKTLKEEG